MGDTKFAFGSCDLTELKCINSGVSPDVTPNNNNNNNNTVNDIVCSNNNNNITNNYNNNNTFSNSSNKTIDENILNLTNCRYYTVSEFYNSADNHSLNILLSVNFIIQLTIIVLIFHNSADNHSLNIS